LRLLTLARDLRRRKARENTSLFTIEGTRAVEELVRSSLRIVGALAAPQLRSNPRGAALRDTLARRGIDLLEVTTAEFDSAADTDAPQGILAIAEIPPRSLEALAPTGSTRILVLDGVQDPGNVGTMLRTAAALGAEATVALPGTVDLWNAKVVRSAMGAHFLHPALHASWDDLHAFLARTKTSLWGADIRGSALDGADAPLRLAVAVGNEGAGLSASVREAASSLVTLPLASGVESLNVAVAAGILLYELRP
jgi:RNA methyltransferase, TrmH family